MTRPSKKPPDPVLRRLREGGHMRTIADRLGIKRQAPYTWKQVPAEHALVVSEISGLSLHDIRPDIYSPGSYLLICPDSYVLVHVGPLPTLKVPDTPLSSAA
jgi:hypothetical protein